MDYFRLVEKVHFKINRTETEAFFVVEYKKPKLYDLIHYHPEVQITLCVNGRGDYFIGGSNGRFSEGDIFIIGKNVPHVFHSDSYENQKNLSHTISVFLDYDFLETTLFRLASFAELKLFLKDPFVCLVSRSSQHLINDFKKLIDSVEMEKALFVLELLKKLKKVDTFEMLGRNFVDSEPKNSTDLNNVIRYIELHYHEVVTLPSIASLANLSIPAFSRRFKKCNRHFICVLFKQL